MGLNISLYALFVKGGVQSVEAGLKYFLVGLLVTCLLFFAVILFFFEYFSLDFSAFNFINLYGSPLSGSEVGLSYLQRVVVLLALTAFVFKLGAFPFHFYLADVYHSASWRLLYLYTVPLKVVVFGVLLKFLIVFGSAGGVVSPFLEWSALGSVAVGAFGALRQQTLRRFWAYSYVSSLGFILFGLGLYNSGLGYVAFNAKLYFVVYLITWHAIFFIFYTTRLVSAAGHFKELLLVSQLPALRSGPGAAKASALMLFSLMGLPPALGFFSKFAIYLQVLEGSAGALYILFLLLLTPVLGFGYLRLLLGMLITTRGRLKTTVVAHTCGLFSAWEVSVALFYAPMCTVFLPVFHLLALTATPLDLQYGLGSTAYPATSGLVFGGEVVWLLFSVTWPIA